ncbi:hypothetical protein [Boseongicola aestuarii]|uniref:hypothetical protein n=1 Tax=Boseongicola aestuarii TaxID=1470561 RepID=UPI000BB4542C|nr:hypothetical protein [Boseongicola aestuarii]
MTIARHAGWDFGGCVALWGCAVGLAAELREGEGGPVLRFRGRFRGWFAFGRTQKDRHEGAGADRYDRDKRNGQSWTVMAAKEVLGEQRPRSCFGEVAGPGTKRRGGRVD